MQQPPYKAVYPFSVRTLRNEDGQIDVFRRIKEEIIAGETGGISLNNSFSGRHLFENQMLHDRLLNDGLYTVYPFTPVAWEDLDFIVRIYEYRFIQFRDEEGYDNICLVALVDARIDIIRKKRIT